MERDTAFEHSSTFAPGEMVGNLRLGGLEATYGEMFADVIEDGIITVEERQQLDRMADALGLDKARLKNLEDALSAVYETKQRVKIVDLSAEEPAPQSIMPFEPATDARTQALQRRIEQLETRIAQLEKELQEARAHVAVEVDLSGIEPAVTATNESAEALQRRLAHDPRDVDTLRALYKSHARARELDKQACVAHVLSFLGAANDEERALYTKHRTEGLIKPRTSLGQDAWRRMLMHPEEEPLVGEIFAVIAGAVLLGRVAALKRDKQLPHLDPATKQDPATSTIQAVRCFAWAGSILGLGAPALYADPDHDGVVQMVPSVPPVARLGSKALSGRSPSELAFFAGRHLAWYREERFMRLLVPNVQDLEDLFLTAISIGNPGLPLRADVKRRVVPLAQAIEPILEANAIDRLRTLFLRFVEEGGRTNLQRWAQTADYTAARAGLLLCDDLATAKTMLEMEDASHATERVDDLLVFVTSDRFANLRRHIGIAAT